MLVEYVDRILFKVACPNKFEQVIIIIKSVTTFILICVIKIIAQYGHQLMPTKVQKIRDTAYHYHGLYFDLQLNTFILLSCWHSQCLHKLVFLAPEPTDM